MELNPIANSSQAGVLQAFATGTSAWHVSLVVTAVVLAIFAFGSRDKYPDLPWLNPKEPTELTAAKRRAEFFAKPREILQEGSQKFSDKPYKLHTNNGPVLIIPPKYVTELKSDRRLDFQLQSNENAHSYLPGFEPFDGSVKMSQLVNRYLTKSLVSLTGPISLEATESLRDVFAEPKEWTQISPADIMRVVSRMSARIFMGKEHCNDPEWIEASSDYTMHAFQIIFKLAKWPGFLRRLINSLSPESARLRQKLQRCRDVLRPHIEQRKMAIIEAKARGEELRHDDAITWFEEVIGPDIDPAISQITLSLVAIHTTSDLLTQTLFDLAKNPELLAPLRQEVIDVLSVDGLKKSAFQKLVLMDSCLKESQRLRPVFNAYFVRRALADVVLSDGFRIKKGTVVAMDGTRVLLDEDLYPEPHRYNPYRFTEMRKTPGGENKAHLVSVTAEHFGFGHGIHACPGRFFAANELKIALAHILLKYDWKLAEGCEDLQPVAAGFHYAYNPNIKLLIKRRKEELDLDSLEF
ncbi:hypothetical protein ACKVWC_001517 [Pyricularia oryzae]